MGEEKKIFIDEDWKSQVAAEKEAAAQQKAPAAAAGAEASTDANLTAQILAYSRAKGLFAGLAIKGATLEDDLDANASFYGKPLSAKQVTAIPSTFVVPPEIESWRKRLGSVIASARP